MKTILVTGGCGFIGSHVVDVLAQKGYHVVVIDKLTYAGRRGNLPLLHIVASGIDPVQDIKSCGWGESKVVLVAADICDYELMDKLAKLADGVIHLAAESHVDRSYKNTESFVMSNIVGAYAALQSVRGTEKRIVHVSTDEVYGHQTEGFVQENEKLSPRNPYSAFKASADLIAQTYTGCFDVNCVIVRPSNNYGPRQYPEKLIPRAITCILNRTKLPIHGDGQHIRDWLWVKDNAKAIVMTYEEGKAGDIFNIAAHEYLPVLDVVHKVCQHLDYDPDDLIEFVDDRKYADRRYAMDPSRINALGWKPTVKFDEGVETTVDWYVRRFKQLDYDGGAKRYGAIDKRDSVLESV